MSVLAALIKRVQQLADSGAGNGSLTPGHYTQNVELANKHVGLARNAVESGDLDLAIGHSLEVVANRPGWLPGYRLLGEVLDRNGQSEQARFCFQGNLPSEIWRAAFPTASSHKEASPDDIAGLTQIVVSSESRIQLNPPNTLDDPLHPAFRRQFIEPATPQVDILHQGSLWHDAHNTVLYSADGRSIGPHTQGNPIVLETLKSRCTPNYIGNRVVVLGARGVGNYYHWMTDILPKFSLLEQAGIEIDSVDRFVVPFMRSSFHWRTLEHLGVSPSQVYVSDEHSPYICADELVVPYLRNTMATTMGKWVPDFLRRSFLPHPPAMANRKLFIGRDTDVAKGRGIDNHTEIEQLFHSAGFDTVYPEKLTIPEQAHLFASAAVIAAPHGAGLTNIVFCQSGTRIIEFYGAHLSPCYWALSNLLNLDYHCCGCDSRQVPEYASMQALRTHQSRKTADFHIPADKARQLLNMAA